MASVDAVDLKRQMIERGIDPHAIDTLVPDLNQWLGAFSCPEENVERVVEVIRASPLIPRDVAVHGLIFCPDDGHLDVVVRGY